MRKKLCSILLAVAMSGAVLSSSIPAYAAQTDYAILTAQSYSSDSYHVTMPAGVTEEMCQPSYWYDKGLGNENTVLATQDEIQEINAKALASKGAMMYDITALQGSFNADTLAANLRNEEVPTRALYINDIKIDNESYFGHLRQVMEESAYTGTQPYRYAICTTRADMRSWPTDDVIGYSTTDADDEMQGSALILNEPFVIQQKCEYDGKTFYWGKSTNCSGWVEAGKVAICKDYQEWIDAWKVNPKGKNFMVVTQNKIITEPSIEAAYSSSVEISLGSVLKLVPADQIPSKIGERNDWYQHVVYLPVRAEDGSYQALPALIAGKYQVSIGYLPYTQKNVLDVAYTCLGDRYGWGGMLNSMDCSMYTRSIYRCFGFELPRNTNWQQEIPGTRISLEGMTVQEKYETIASLPIGTLLYFKGHTMVYSGTDGDQNYVISCTGSVSDSTGDVEVKSVYTCILNPLNVRRASGLTWLESLTAAVVFTNLDQAVLKEENVIYASDVSKTAKNKNQTFQLTASNKADLPISYQSDRSSVSVDNKGRVTVKAGFIGKAHITITTAENNRYNAAKKVITIQVLPEKVSLQSVKAAGKKALKVKWKANAQATGYQLQYSLSKTFAKNNKSVFLKKSSTTSKTIKGLKKGKAYYVRIRAYKDVKGQKVYSNWSHEKHAKVK